MCWGWGRKFVDFEGQIAEAIEGEDSGDADAGEG